MSTKDKRCGTCLFWTRQGQGSMGHCSEARAPREFVEPSRSDHDGLFEIHRFCTWEHACCKFHAEVDRSWIANWLKEDRILITVYPHKAEDADVANLAQDFLNWWFKQEMLEKEESVEEEV